MRRNDTRGHRATKAKGIADRQHPVADTCGFFGKFHKREFLLGFDLEQRQVGPLIGTNDIGLMLIAIVHGDGDLTGIVNDVVIGHYIAVIGNDET